MYKHASRFNQRLRENGAKVASTKLATIDLTKSKRGQQQPLAKSLDEAARARRRREQLTYEQSKDVCIVVNRNK